MKAIEFEATADKSSIRLPESIPDGTHLRVLLLMNDTPPPAATDEDLKQLLSQMTEGLTDADLHRPQDFGRGEPEWAT